MSETKIVSFVLRFVQRMGDDAEAPTAIPETSVEEVEYVGRPLAPGWHGVIRHVQSREEVRFTHVNDALTFIHRYVAFEEEKEAEADGEI